MRCRKCRSDLPDDAFALDRSRRRGRKYVCRDCDSTRKTSGPPLHHRRLMLARGLRWCYGCLQWLPIKRSPCRVCANAEARQRYATDPKHRDRRRQHARSRARGTPEIPLALRVILTEIFGGRCAYCPAPATTWDHVVPISRDGGPSSGNILPACVRCNSSKRDRDLDAWVASRGMVPHEDIGDVLIMACV